LHVLAGDFRLLVGNLDAFVFRGLEFRIHLELRFEMKRFAVVEMDVGNARRAHHAQVLFLRPRIEKTGHEVFQHLLPDVAREAAADQRRRRFAWTESGQPGPVLKRFSDFLGFGFDSVGWNRDFKLVLATFQ
jgi:hypothetical protein